MIFSQTIKLSLSLLYFPISLYAEKKSERPNVIVIVTDDQGYGDMSCHGNPWLKTPHLDSLKKDGVSLDDYHVDPVCTPTRAALMTGRHCVRVGAWAVTRGRQLLNPNEKTMANIFSDSGYRTGMFGKWHLGDTFPYAPRFRGFDDTVRHMAGGVDEIGNPSENDYIGDTYYRNGKPEPFHAYCTNVWFEETIKWLNQPKEKKPFFIYLPLNAMHGPYIVEPQYSERFKKMGLPEARSNFFGMIENFDENLGRLLTSLQETAQDENTLIIFMGDNGTARGADGIPGKESGYNAGMRGRKSSVFEGGHRVACFAKWPARFPPGLQIEELTSHRDWLPTLIDLCNLKAPEGVKFDGMSIAPLLTGKAKIWPDRTLILDRQNVDFVKPELTEKGHKGPHFAVLTEKWRFANGQLFDIENDPGQTNNLVKQYPAVVKELYQSYEDWFADVTKRDDPYTRFQIGVKDHPETLLTVRDWHPTVGNVIWQQRQLSDDKLFINGFWAIDVKETGTYQITLSRFPSDRRQAIKATQARLKIGEQEFTKPLEPGVKTVTFPTQLKAGKALLQTWLTDVDTKKERGAYFVAIKK